MRFMITGRRTGKTEAAYNGARDTGGILVVHDYQTQARMEKRLKTDPKAIKATKVIVLSDMYTLSGHDRDRDVYIDNIDLILNYMVRGRRIALVTGTGELDDPE